VVLCIITIIIIILIVMTGLTKVLTFTFNLKVTSLFCLLP
jgi:hypothetical protein